jgi:hypothetical protein
MKRAACLSDSNSWMRRFNAFFTAGHSDEWHYGCLLVGE